MGDHAPRAFVRSFLLASRSRNSNAEVDYVIEHAGRIVPIEVKAGRRGGMRSLHMFLDSHSSPFGIRTSLEPFASHERIRIIPLYALGTVL